MATKRKQGGLTIIELIVVMAAMAILLVLLIPVITGLPEEANIGRARQDAKAIGEAIINFHKDLAKWPVYASSSPGLTPANATLERLFSLGNVPQVSGATGTADWVSASNSDELADHLQSNLLPNGTRYPTTGEFAWRGPYLLENPEDPWGNRFIVNVKWLQPGASPHAVWVLSAGPNRIIETTFSQANLAGDDIGFRVK